MLRVVTSFVLTHFAGRAEGVRLDDDSVEAIGKSFETSTATCGRKGGGLGAKIVKGDNTSACEWRWQVGLHGNRDKKPFCGGSLIAENWVLTAAHCVTREVLVSMDKTIYVVVGDIFGYSYQAHETEVIVSHPDYDDVKISNDYALIKLKKSVDLGTCVGTVCLPEDGEEAAKPGSKCWTTGYGRLDGGEGLPDKLQEIPMTIKASWVCNFLRLYPWGTVKKNMICGQGYRGWFQTKSQSTCNGDSGGPLVCQANGKWTLFGVTSFGGPGCSSPYYSPVWSRVHYALDWIKSTMAEHDL